MLKKTEKLGSWEGDKHYTRRDHKKIVDETNKTRIKQDIQQERQKKDISLETKQVWKSKTTEEKKKDRS